MGWGRGSRGGGRRGGPGRGAAAAGRGGEAAGAAGERPRYYFDPSPAGGAEDVPLGPAADPFCSGAGGEERPAAGSGASAAAVARRSSLERAAARRHGGLLLSALGRERPAAAPPPRSARAAGAEAAAAPAPREECAALGDDAPPEAAEDRGGAPAPWAAARGPGAGRGQAPAALATPPPARAGSETDPIASDDLSDPDVVFTCCDTDESGRLDVHELRFALNSFGLFPDPEIVAAWMGEQDALDRAEFRELLRLKLASAPSSMRRPRAVPYARRGVTLQQLDALDAAFVRSGWIEERCDEFNERHAGAIADGAEHRLSPNLYALDRFVVRPATSPRLADAAAVPPELLRRARLPPAAHECSYSELVNPGGARVDTFVSHFWGHPFSDTMAALQGWAGRAHGRLGHAQPEDTVFWLCFLALNQHYAGEEVGSSPEEGPFNAALTQAKGAVMVLDDEVNPFRRIWCLFEVKRLTDLKKDFELICARGPVGSLLAAPAAGGSPADREEALRCVAGISAALEGVSALGASASSEADKLAIWHRVADPMVRQTPLQLLLARRPFLESDFKRFDLVIRGLLAGPLFRASLASGDRAAALRHISLGAAFGPKDLGRLAGLLEADGRDVCSVEVPVKRGAAWVDWRLLHCAAYFGHLSAIEDLVHRGASVEAATSFGMTPAHLAASNGHGEAIELLVRCGAQVDCRQSELRTPVHFAAVSGHLEAVRALVRLRASLAGRDRKQETVLHAAVLGGSAEVVACLLDHRADASAAARGAVTPLHLAARDGRAAVAERLLGAAPALAGVSAGASGTPLELAESRGHHDLADWLRERSPRPAPAPPAAEPPRGAARPRGPRRPAF